MIVAVCALVITLSKVSSGTHRLSSDTRQTAELAYAAMIRWRDESAASRNPFIAYTNAVYAQAYANILRNSVDDAQSMRLFGVNMQRTTQEIERLVNQKTRLLMGRFPGLNSGSGSAATVRTGHV